MNERESLILGSLLHDIGKFSHRAEEKLRLEYDKNLRTFYCPTDYGYSHLLYSGQFVKDIFKDKESPIENLVLSHHKPDSFKGDKKLPKIIQLADYLSSGERRERDESEKGVVKKEPIISIFSQLLIKDEKNGEIYKPEELYNRPVKIDNNLEKLVPVEKKDAITDNYNFKKLWEEFKDECQYLNYPSNFEKIFTQIFSLLEKYTLFIPSSAYTDKPEISLFHHLKLTCAIATCLYDLNIAKET
ncbi:MAG TPA: HD domain-containing protein, partial [bacterium]|nr:HD domain-containing protein [bacterium]